MASEHNHRTEHTRMLRVRVPGEHARVSTFELFFDLIFVFAVTQLSHKLAGNLTGEGVLQATLLLLAIWWVWVYTTWATNFTDPDHLAVRLVLVAIMLGGLIMSAAIPEAFDGRGYAFAIPYVAIQVGRSAFVLFAGRDDELFRRNFLRITVWLAGAGVIWLAGAAADNEGRVALWIAALAIEYAGPPAGFWLPRIGKSAASDWHVEGAHMAERCGLFIIIALGESLLVTGATFSGHPWTNGTVLAMVSAFSAAVAMWWVYFDVMAEAASERIAHASDPGALARLAYTYFHLPMVAGIVVVAVGDELVLAHPHGSTSLSEGLTIAGGPALFLAGYALFKRAIVGRFFGFHALLFALLAAAFGAREAVSPVALTWLTTAVLVTAAVRGRFGHRPAPTFEVEPERGTAAEAPGLAPD